MKIFSCVSISAVKGYYYEDFEIDAEDEKQARKIFREYVKTGKKDSRIHAPSLGSYGDSTQYKLLQRIEIQDSFEKEGGAK